METLHSTLMLKRVSAPLKFEGKGWNAKITNNENNNTGLHLQQSVRKSIVD